MKFSVPIVTFALANIYGAAADVVDASKAFHEAVASSIGDATVSMTASAKPAIRGGNKPVTLSEADDGSELHRHLQGTHAHDRRGLQYSTTPAKQEETKAHRKLAATFYTDEAGYNEAGGNLIDLCEDFNDSPVGERQSFFCSDNPLSSSDTPDACFNTLKPGFTFGSSKGFEDSGVVAVGAGFRGLPLPSTAIAAYIFADSNIIRFDGGGISGLSFQLYGSRNTTITAYDVDNTILASAVVGVPSFVGIISTTTTLIKQVEIDPSEEVDDLCFGHAGRRAGGK